MRIDRNKQILNTAAHKCRPLQQENAKYYQKQILGKYVSFVHVWLNNILYNVQYANCSRSIVTVAPWLCKQPENPEVGAGW